jgi:hypothetical protein
MKKAGHIRELPGEMLEAALKAALETVQENSSKKNMPLVRLP